MSTLITLWQSLSRWSAEPESSCSQKLGRVVVSILRASLWGPERYIEVGSLGRMSGLLCHVWSAAGRQVVVKTVVDTYMTTKWFGQQAAFSSSATDWQLPVKHWGLTSLVPGLKCILLGVYSLKHVYSPCHGFTQFHMEQRVWSSDTQAVLAADRTWHYCNCSSQNTKLFPEAPHTKQQEGTGGHAMPWWDAWAVDSGLRTSEGGHVAMQLGPNPTWPASQLHFTWCSWDSKYTN